jgi:hypothetical protein
MEIILEDLQFDFGRLPPVMKRWLQAWMILLNG